MQDPSNMNAKSTSQDGSKSTTPNRGSHHHRRAQSETNFRLPNDLDPLDAPTTSFEEIASDDDLFTTYLDVDKLGSRIDDDCSAYIAYAGEKMSAAQSHIRHRHSNSVDGSLNSSGDNLLGDVMEPKKAMHPDKLAELWTLDPKRVKRILANRQSASRSKERKARYILELERKVQTLQTETTTLSVQLTLFQRDTMDLTIENTELKLRLQASEQQAQLRDALNEVLKQEVKWLKIGTGESVNSSDSFHLGMHYMPYHSSSVFSFPQPGPGGGHRNIQSQFHPSQTNLTSHNMLAAHSSSLSELQQDPLGRLKGLAISNGAKSKGPSISASESSNTL